jgi:hypothetical protein
MLWSIIIGMLVTAFGIPIGDFLYKKTKEEIKSGQKWFKIIVVVGLMGAIVSIFLKNDFLFFSFLFISIVTSRSLAFKK